jgi:hypothetical protein
MINYKCNEAEIRTEPLVICQKKIQIYQNILTAERDLLRPPVIVSLVLFASTA